MIPYQIEFHVFPITGNLCVKGYVLRGTPVQVTEDTRGLWILEIETKSGWWVKQTHGKIKGGVWGTGC